MPFITHQLAGRLWCGSNRLATQWNTLCKIPVLACPAVARNLFSKFFRAGNARKAPPDRTGLGLFMAKKVIVAQDGAVVFRSAEGKGSTFGFTFSKAKLAPEGEE